MRQTRTPLLTRSKAVKSPDGLYPPPPSEAWGLPPSAASQGPSGSAGHSAAAPLARGGGFRNGSFIMRSAGAAVSLHAGKSTSSEDDPNMNNRRSIDKSTSSSSSSGSRPGAGMATNSFFFLTLFTPKNFGRPTVHVPGQKENEPEDEDESFRPFWIACDE